MLKLFLYAQPSRIVHGKPGGYIQPTDRQRRLVLQENFAWSHHACDVILVIQGYIT